MLEHTCAAKGVDQVVLATTNDPRDDLVDEQAQSWGYSVFRGSEQDVLSRYFEAAKVYKADVIIRVTGITP